VYPKQGLTVASSFADAPRRTIRLVYAISVATHNVYRFPVLYTQQFGEGGVAGGGGIDVVLPPPFSFFIGIFVPVMFA
jgi:hypothetical protein